MLVSCCCILFFLIQGVKCLLERVFIFLNEWHYEEVLTDVSDIV